MMPQEILWEHLDDFVLVDDAEMRAAMRLLLERAKTLAEPAGAASLAAALRFPELVRGKRTALILSGGNASLDELRAILAA
jgi:threonine dehydratase